MLEGRLRRQSRSPFKYSSYSIHVRRITLISLDARYMVDPPAQYRPAPLWIWNDDMNEQRIREQLKELKQHGFGGAFVHPRPGLVTPYFGDEWFELWSAALDEAELLDLKLYIYDENSYPSGFAGGHIPSELPDCLANSVVMRELQYSDLPSVLPVANGTLNRPGHPIRMFAIQKSLDNKKYEIVQDVTNLPFSEWEQYSESFLMFELGSPETNAWLGGFAYPDLMRPEVAQLFLSHTYEAYRSRYGNKFGTRIPAIFTDEPEISPGNLFKHGADFLPFTYWFSGQFEERNGYDIKDYLPYLFLEVGGGILDRDPLKVRYDYYHTIHELWVGNYVSPISDWCQMHNIAWTGHYVEHNWPYPWGRSSPCVMSLYEYMQWPAIDALRTSLLREEGWVGVERLMLTIREASSVANQFNRERVLCEMYGAGGWDSEFKDYKRIGDWLFVHGITFMTQHLTFSTIVGARKRDHPQSFDWRQPWWNEYTGLNDYFSRLSYMLSQGETRNRVLLLNPSTSGYLYTPGSQIGELRVLNNPPLQPDMRSYLDIVQGLCDLQWNYDLGDEYIMERHGHAESRLLSIGRRRYDVVIYPESMETMKASTWKLLEQFLQSGGIVLALGGPCKRIDGAASEEAFKLSDYENWIPVSGLEQLNEQLARLIPKELQWVAKERLPRGIHHLRRVLPGGSSVYFIVNSSDQPIKSPLRIKAAHANLWNPWIGVKEPLKYSRIGDHIQFEAEIPVEGSLLVQAYETMQPEEKLISLMDENNLPKPAIPQAVPLAGPMVVIPERDNMLVLDYCDLQVGTKRYTGISTIHAQKLIYEFHGFESNPWDNSVQFKRRLLDRNHFSEKSGFKAAFHFHVANHGRPERMKLWVERADLYGLEVNGHAVPWSGEATDLDHHLIAADIASFVVEGENVIELVALPFDIMMELEPIYLTGTFSVTASDGKWIVDNTKPLDIGSWKSQGYPFYGYGVRYENKVIIADMRKRYTICLPQWTGTVASVHINGSLAGLFGVGQGDELDISPYLNVGEHSAD
jgi:hypothetical protein